MSSWLDHPADVPARPGVSAPLGWCVPCFRASRLRTPAAFIRDGNGVCDYHCVTGTGVILRGIGGEGHVVQQAPGEAAGPAGADTDSA